MKYAISLLLCCLLSFNYLGIVPSSILPEQVYLTAIGLSMAYIWPNIPGIFISILTLILAIVLPELNNPYSSIQSYKYLVVGFIPVVLIASWKSAGMGFLLTGVMFFVYAILGHLLPDPFTAYSLNILKLGEFLVLDNTAMLGTSLEIACTTVFIFMALGVALQQSNLLGLIDNWLVKKLVNTRGNGAKVAILSSAAFGMVSGSAVANVVAAGHMTIPLMIKTGYSKVAAASIEAVSSTMGQVTPPVMGAAAFLMVSLTGIPYSSIALSATIPAILLYTLLLLYVHFTAKKATVLEIEPVSLKWPSFKTTVLELSELMSQMIVLGAVVGIILGILDQTGILFNLTNDIIRSASGGMHILIVTALVCIVIGLGMPTTTTYLLVAIMLGPSLVASNFDTLASHLFILYYSCISMVTPPIALASMSAANIAGANHTKTAIMSFLLAIPFMILPFIFIYWPALIFR